MKKAVVALTTAVVAVSILVLSACAPNTPVITKVGLGHITSIASSTSLTTGADGPVAPTAQVDTIMAAVGFDKDGKVLKITIDNAQTKVKYDADLQVASDLAAPGQTKVELGDAYGMGRVSTIKKEWYQQIAEFEKWATGKTVAEIKALKTKGEGDHAGVPDVPELTSLVTITVPDYIAAIEEAYSNSFDANGATKLGLGHSVSIASSVGYSKTETAEVFPSAQVETVMAVTAFDKDGKVVRAVIDNAQTKVNYDAEGKLISDLAEAPKTKVELGDAYGMKKVSTLKKDWYQQIADLEKWMQGKTVEQITAMKVKARDESHPAVPDVPELTSMVTITVQDYLAAVQEAFQKAK